MNSLVLPHLRHTPSISFYYLLIFTTLSSLFFRYWLWMFFYLCQFPGAPPPTSHTLYPIPPFLLCPMSLAFSVSVSPERRWMRIYWLRIMKLFSCLPSPTPEQNPSPTPEQNSPRIPQLTQQTNLLSKSSPLFNTVIYFRPRQWNVTITMPSFDWWLTTIENYWNTIGCNGCQTKNHHKAIATNEPLKTPLLPFHCLTNG